MQTDSVEITHHHNPQKPDQVSYSICKIKRVKTPRDFGLLSLWTTFDFSIPYQPPGFNYIDYQRAWFNMFYLRTFDHSWFISFSEHCPRTFPSWFMEWWHYLGPTPAYYPTQITQLSLPYYKKYANVPTSPFIPEINFHIDFNIPWILSWCYTIESHIPNCNLSLVREFHIKWWDKYNLSKCSIEVIQQWLRDGKEFKKAVRAVSQQLSREDKAKAKDIIPMPTTPLKIPA